MSRLDLGSAYRQALGRLREWAALRLDGKNASEPELEPSPGQLVSTLLACGERGLADRALSALLERQQPEGSWPGSSARSSLRETADALRGLLAALPSRPATRAALRRACDDCVRRARPQSSSSSDDGDATGLAVAASLADAADALGDYGLRDAARRGGFRDDARHMVHRHQDRLAFLLDLGRLEAAEPLLRDGERAMPACPTCVAQLASAFYRVGRRQAGDEALRWLLAPDVAAPRAAERESPAAARELLEVIHGHIAAAFAGQVGEFEDHVRRGDGRFAFLLQEAGPLAGQAVLDAGCGRGALARALLTAYPSARLTAVDHSPEMLRHVPEAAQPRRGSIQCLPFEDGRFDVAYCVEALEHACNPEGAVDELCRVVRPGGRVLIVDKNAERSGALPIEAWERWFERREVEAWLAKRCGEVRSALLAHCPELGPGLFVGWSGTRR